MMRILQLDKQIKKFFEGKCDRNYFTSGRVNKSDVYDVMQAISMVYFFDSFNLM